MQTNFTSAQLANPDIAEADEILRKCVHCGFCTATCPTFILTGDERDSPRGRIWLIRDLLENDTMPGDVVGHHLDRCLTCLSCSTTCPSGVDYMHLVDIGRRHADERRQRGLMDRVCRHIIVSVLPYAPRAWMLLTLAWVFKPLRFLLPRGLSGLVSAVPRTRPRFDRVGHKDQVFSPESSRLSGRVLLLQGCVQRAVNPDINGATIRLLNRLGVEVVVRKAAYCCGGLVHHSGDAAEAEKAMFETIAAWSDESSVGTIDAVVINSSGCGTVVKDYGHRFVHHSDYAEKAAAISAKTMDICEFLARFDFGKMAVMEAHRGLRVAYHGACSLEHGQRIKATPKELLEKLGFEVGDIAEGHLCCGSAGTYSALQPGLATPLKVRKLQAIASASADIVAAGNLGCISQLAESRTPIVHTVQLLDWATGGPKPRELRRLK